MQLNPLCYSRRNTLGFIFSAKYVHESDYFLHFKITNVVLRLIFPNSHHQNQCVQKQKKKSSFPNLAVYGRWGLRIRKVDSDSETFFKLEIGVNFPQSKQNKFSEIIDGLEIVLS